MGARIFRVLLAAAVISIFASVAIGTYLRGKQACFVVTLSPEGEPAEGVIQAVVKALSRRTAQYGKDFGVVRSTISAEEDGPITMKIWAEGEIDGFLRCLTQTGEMEFRLVKGRGKDQKPDAEHELVSWRQEYYSIRELGQKVVEVMPFLVRKKPEHRVRSFASVSCRTEGLGGNPVITLQLHPEDARALNQVRRANTGKEMAVVIDGAVLVSAVVAGSVETDRIEIRGIRGVIEARRVAAMLEIGALPVKLTVTKVEKVKSAT